MNGQGKLALRPLPHLDFVLGWPGIPGSTQTSRNAAHIAGNVEVRLGSKGMKAKWLRIELRKIETVPGGENWGELIGKGPIDVWSARSGEGKGDRETDPDGSCWEVLKTADFPFRINIPEALPPTAKLDKLCGIQYEVVTSLCVKTKKGLLRKEDISSIIQSVQPIVLSKHELHSTWPAYNQPDTHSGERDQMRAKLRRDRYCYAPGDKVRVKVIVSSNRVEPAKLKSVAVTIKETVTFHGVKPRGKSITSNSASAKPSMQRVEVVTQRAKQIGKKLYKGDSKDFDLELVVPKSHSLMTISTGKHIEVSYTMRLYVDISKAPIVVDHIPMMMTTFTRQTSLSMMKKIGFVEGLSEREMLIDDDMDDSSTTHGVSRSVRPVPSRSLSFAGSTSTGGYDTAGTGFLARRDTVMTNATGGMAGRGVPGQLFSFNPYGPAPPLPIGLSGDMPRPAFAGPDATVEEEPQLSAMERTALYHHTNDPRNAMAMGVDYGAIAALEPTRSSFTPMREASPANHANQRASFAGFPTPYNPISRPSTAKASTAAAAAEEEKERLYERARKQAERNQRRADERRAALAAGTMDSSTMSQSEIASLPASEQEKLKLWERARREAEAYQRSFSEGATFPAEGPSRPSSRMHTPSLPPVDEQAMSSVPPAARRPNTSPDKRRSSAMFWLDSPSNASPPPPTVQRAPAAATGASSSYPSYPSAEEEKRRLYERAKAETEAHLNGPGQGSAMESSASSNLNGHQDGPPASASAPVALTEKEQMKRFYAAREAVQQNQAQSDAGHATVSSSAAVNVSSPAIVSSSSVANTDSGSDLPTASSHVPLSEKEQMRRFHAAQEAVQQFQGRGEGSSPVAEAPLQAMEGTNIPGSSSHPLSEKEQLAHYHAAQEEVQRYQAQMHGAETSMSTQQPGKANGLAATSPQPPAAHEIKPANVVAPPTAAPVRSTSSALTEKEQMRQYWAAREQEAQMENQTTQAGGSGSGSVGVHNMASPRPVYAPNFHGLPFTAPANVKGSPASTPLPQGPFQAPPFAGTPNGKPRIVSYTPTTHFSQQQQQQQQQRAPQQAPAQGRTGQHLASCSLSLPPFAQLTLNHRGGTPTPSDGPWAPKMAAPAWADDDDDDSQRQDHEVPPPLPPKTILSP